MVVDVYLGDRRHCDCLIVCVGPKCSVSYGLIPWIRRILSGYGGDQMYVECGSCYACYIPCWLSLDNSSGRTGVFMLASRQ